MRRMEPIDQGIGSTLEDLRLPGWRTYPAARSAAATIA